eukprot:3604577-Rhodomonas_salina.7
MAAISAYAKPGTDAPAGADSGYAPTRMCYAVSCTTVAYAPTRQSSHPTSALYAPSSLSALQMRYAPSCMILPVLTALCSYQPAPLDLGSLSLSLSPPPLSISLSPSDSPAKTPPASRR